MRFIAGPDNDFFNIQLARLRPGDNINFNGGALATPPQPARIVCASPPGQMLARLMGYVWAENIGWINLGGTPVSNIQYTNTTGADCGVNVSSTGGLSGLGWSENIGWINFAGGALATPAQPARLDIPAGRLRGYAWSENIGWINLDVATAGQFVKRTCYANCDGSTGFPLATANDFQCFLNAYVSHQAYANCDRSSSPPTLTANDFQCFLDSYVSGCS